jgi:hypothetical protein
VTPDGLASKFRSVALQCCVFHNPLALLSALLTAGIFIGLCLKPGDGGDMFLRNVS